MKNKFFFAWLLLLLLLFSFSFAACTVSTVSASSEQSATVGTQVQVSASYVGTDCTSESLYLYPSTGLTVTDPISGYYTGVASGTSKTFLVRASSAGTYSYYAQVSSTTSTSVNIVFSAPSSVFNVAGSPSTYSATASSSFPVVVNITNIGSSATTTSYSLSYSSSYFSVSGDSTSSTITVPAGSTTQLSWTVTPTCFTGSNSLSLSLGSTIGVFTSAVTSSACPSSPSSGESTTTKSLLVSALSICPGEILEITTTSSGSAVEGTEVRLALVEPYEGTISQKSTNSSGAAAFVLGKSGIYEAYVSKTGYIKPSTLRVNVSLCTTPGVSVPPQLNASAPTAPPTAQPNVTTNVSTTPSANLTTPNVTQTKADADSAISATESAIAVAKNGGKNTTAAESKLAEAKTEYGTGSYTKAKQLADEALTLAQNAPALQQPATPPATTPATKTQDTKPKTDEGLLTGLGLLGLLLFIVVLFILRPPKQS